MPQKTAVIGLGSMGYGVARSILRAGHETYGFDVVPAQVEKFRSEGGAEGLWRMSQTVLMLWLSLF